MMISEFLTSIAKDFNPRIRSVSFEDLTLLKSKPVGVAYQPTPLTYLIEIDRARLICPYQVLYVFYHELGHIMSGHVGYHRHVGYSEHGLVGHAHLEAEADAWAFLHMHLIDSQGNVNEETRLCYECFASKSKICLKNPTRG